jgi:allantoate deiminase
MQRINALASITEDEGRVTRTYGTHAFIRGRDLVQQWMKDAGLETRVDNIGNIRARLLSGNPAAKTFVIASHIDTIINAGKFDGPMGVLIGLDLLEQLKHNKTELPFHIELIGFCDEEGCRFHTTYLGSKAVAGCFDETILDTKDANGIALQDVIEQNGGDIKKLKDDAIPKKDWLGYFEIHIEQGPVLYEKNSPVAIVSAIAGQRRAGLIFNGEAGHAGTVPMHMRKDALTCAAEFILVIEKFAADEKNFVNTVGKLHIINAASNVIPGEVIISLDLRSADEYTLVNAYEAVKSLALDICKDRGIALEWNDVQQSNPVTCDPTLNNHLAAAISDCGYEVLKLVSGAGHDAVPISTVAPVSMLFVRCFKGISHNPLENVELADLAAALEVSDGFLMRLTNQTTNNFTKRSKG